MVWTGFVEQCFLGCFLKDVLILEIFGGGGGGEGVGGSLST